MKKTLIYSCMFLLLLSCNVKSGKKEVSQSPSVEQTTHENIPEEVSAVVSEPLSMKIYQGSDWMIPDTFPPALQKEPEKSSLQDYVPDSICRKQIDGVERSFYNGALMNGAYKHFYSRATHSFVSEPCYSVTVYKDGIKNDTVRHYSLSSHRMTYLLITPDSIHEEYQSFYSNGVPYIVYQATRGKLDGVRQRWYYDGKPDWFEHYKDGKRHGEELRWYTNGHLWQRNHYVDDEEAFPRESWYYNAAESDYAYSGYSQEAPDRYKYTYQASEGSSPYYIEETYALENGKKKYNLQRRYLTNDLNKKISLPGFQCDSVRRDVVTIGSQKRLEIRIFNKGHLWRFESYPYSEGGVPGVMAESYSEDGSLTEKSMYDYHSEEMKFLRIYSSKGADVKRLTHEEYTNAKADSCNKEFSPGKERYTDSKDKLSIRWEKGELALLNSPLLEDEDGYIKWYYDGYYPDYGLHFFHYAGYENWGNFVMSDTTGEVYEYRAMDTPLFCGKAGLFLVADGNPYEGGCFVRIYQMLPEGRLAEVAVLDRGGFYSEIDLEGFLWVSESAFIARKNLSDEELQYDFYRGCTDSCLEDYRKHGYLPEDKDESGWEYVRVDLHPDALKTKQELPSSLTAIKEMNEWIKTQHAEFCE